MGRISGLVPSRFLTLMAHLVVVITLFWSRDSNVLACLPLRFTPEQYKKRDIELAHHYLWIQRLSFTLVRFQAIGAHCSASVALSFFIFERWECTTYWYIFAFCSALPAVTEVALFVAVFGLRKKPF
ncbi:PREDICTED: transmembrane protein 107 isoform X2 [Chinchilla lanigera]|uniref:transmembrane protein 107 isoform X2 n=1 Tax=Chinchilla lanigera TaxID=34839 RepID=UPI00038EF9CC|nr:PREDICTED: transmembrane protein 107 isoform X2 [Chinchilla lanigera]